MRKNDDDIRRYVSLAKIGLKCKVTYHNVAQWDIFYFTWLYLLSCQRETYSCSGV